MGPIFRMGAVSLIFQEKSQVGLEEAWHTSVTRVFMCAEPGPVMVTLRGPSASTVRDDDRRTIDPFSELRLQILILNHRRQYCVKCEHF